MRFERSDFVLATIGTALLSVFLAGTLSWMPAIGVGGLGIAVAGIVLLDALVLNPPSG